MVWAEEENIITNMLPKAQLIEVRTNLVCTSRCSAWSVRMHRICICVINALDNIEKGIQNTLTGKNSRTYWRKNTYTIYNLLPFWPIFMNENGGRCFMVIPSIIAVSPSPLPWFVYSNLLQNVSRSFINPTHLTWHGYFMHIVRADIRTSHKS